MLRYVAVGYGTVRYGTVRYGTVRYGTLEISDKYGLPVFVMSARSVLVSINPNKWACRELFFVENFPYCIGLLSDFF